MVHMVLAAARALLAIIAVVPALSAAAQGAQHQLVLQVTVINCTAVSGSSFFVPLATRLDPISGSLSRRIGTRAAPRGAPGAYNLSSFDSNIAVLPGSCADGGGGDHAPCIGYVEGTDEPPGYFAGVRSVLAAVDLSNDQVLDHVGHL